MVCSGAGALFLLLYAADLLGPFENFAPLFDAVLALSVMTIGIVRRKPRSAWVWWCIVGALALFVAGWIERVRFDTLGDLTAHRSLLPDAITIPGYVLVGVGLLGMSRARTGHQRTGIGLFLDGLLASLGLFVCATVLIIDPVLGVRHSPLTVRLVLSCYPALSLFLVVITLRIAISGGRRPAPAFWFLIATMTSAFAGDVTNMLAELHMIHWQDQWLGLPYMTTFLTASLMTLHPSWGTLTNLEWHGPTVRSWPRVALVAMTLLIPTSVTIFSPRETTETRIMLFTAMVVLTTATVARVIQALIAADRSEARLAFDAMHDSLTGLPNRRMMLEYLTYTLDMSKERQSRVAVIFLDLDRFKLVNDTVGHTRGDRLLVMVAERLRSYVRPTDLVTRIGGDEFMVVLGTSVDEDRALDLAERLRCSLRRPFEVDGDEFFVTASIGLAFSDGRKVEAAEMLIRDADTAMYQAKEAGRDAVLVFDESMRNRVAERVALEHDLRFAIERGQLHLVYQPVVSLDDGTIRSAEALVRWTHPQLGVLSPARFISLAEECGLISRIGTWVLNEAMRQLAEWRSQRPEMSEFRLAVNLSVAQLFDGDLFQQVSQILSTHHLEGGALCLELTESVVMDDPETAVNLLEAFRDAGIRISIDDFGTEYSSLAYLSRLPVDQLKIDRSFVSTLGEEDGADVTLIAAIVAMAGALGISTVAEGVETPVQAQRVAELGCGSGQGYFWSRPVRDDQFLRTYDAGIRSGISATLGSEMDLDGII